MKHSKWTIRCSWITHTLANQQGSVLIISLMIMVVLALLGAVASNMSITEMQSASNERRYTQSFYTAESAWQAVPEVLNGFSDPPLPDAACGGAVINCGTSNINGIGYTYSVTEISPPRVYNRAGLSPGDLRKQYLVTATADDRQTIEIVLNKPFQIPE